MLLLCMIQQYVVRARRDFRIVLLFRAFAPFERGQQRNGI